MALNLEQIQQIEDMYKKGASITKIVRAINFSRDIVYKYLQEHYPEQFKEVEKQTQQPQNQAQTQAQPQPSPQPQPQPTPTVKVWKKLDPEVEKYINNIQVKENCFIDQYGNSYTMQEGKPDINAFKKWAKENPKEIRKHIKRSKEVHEKSLAEKQKTEETRGTANTSNNNSKLS